jgi:hypothetical protein
VGSVIFMTRVQIQKAVELVLILFLYFHTFWHLIYFERSSALVFFSFFALAILIPYSIIRHWEGWRRFGIRLDNLLASLRALILPFLAVVTGSLAIGWLRGWTPRTPDFGDIVPFILWGTFQQWLIQGYFFLRYESIFQNKRLAVTLTAFTFGLFHVPNLGLVTATFLGGLYLSYFFSKWRNLIALGIFHGLVSLTFVTVLKPAGVMPEYRVGPDSLGPIRQIIRRKTAEKFQIGVFVPSQVPGSFKNYFDGQVQAINSNTELKAFLAQLSPVFAVMSENDFTSFQASSPDTKAHLVKSSLIWRRKFPNHKQETLRCILTLNFGRLHQLYRTEMVLISNRAFTGQQYL